MHFELLVGVTILFLFDLISKFEYFWHDRRRQEILAEEFLIVILIVGFLIRGKEVPGDTVRYEPV